MKKVLWYLARVSVFAMCCLGAITASAGLTDGAHLSARGTFEARMKAAASEIETPAAPEQTIENRRLSQWYNWPNWNNWGNWNNWPNWLNWMNY